MSAGLPDKTYFKIGEVARLADIKTSVLRYWETEFAFLSPEKSSSGQRLYSKQDIFLVQQIKQLLYQEKYTIEGVRKKLGKRSKPQSPPQETAPVAPTNYHELLKQVRQELVALRQILT